MDNPIVKFVVGLLFVCFAILLGLQALDTWTTNSAVPLLNRSFGYANVAYSLDTPPSRIFGVCTSGLSFFLIIAVPAFLLHGWVFKGDSRIPRWMWYFFLTILAMCISDSANIYVRATTGRDSGAYGTLLLISAAVFVSLAFIARLGVRAMWLGWPALIFSTVYFAVLGSCALIVSPWWFLVVVAIFASVYGKALFGAWHYLFVRHPAEAIVDPALATGDAIDHRRLAQELQRGLEDEGERSNIYYETQALKAQRLKDKLDADAELAVATAKRERARRAMLDAEKEIEDAKRRGTTP